MHEASEIAQDSTLILKNQTYALAEADALNTNRLKIILIIYGKFKSSIKNLVLSRLFKEKIIRKDYPPEKVQYGGINVPLTY